MLRPETELSVPTFEAIAAIAYDVAGLHLPASKRAMVAGRLSKRMARLGVRDFDAYLAIIAARQAPERGRMIAALTTNVSRFFREEHHFEALRDRVLPPLVARAREGARVRLWSAGCAHGQEAYSIALTLLDAAPDANALDIRILGTDIDPSVVKFARLGAYHAAMMAGVDHSALSAFFTHNIASDTFVAGSALRRLTLFREMNLHGSWPMPGHFDVIFCRNVVIYFDPAGQQRLWARFQDRLVDGGWLMVGHSERIPEDAAPRLRLSENTAYQRL